MNFLDVMSVIGPLQLAVKKMLSDVAKLLVLLVIILLGKTIVYIFYILFLFSYLLHDKSYVLI